MDGANDDSQDIENGNGDKSQETDSRAEENKENAEDKDSHKANSPALQESEENVSEPEAQNKKEVGNVEESVTSPTTHATEEKSNYYDTKIQTDEQSTEANTNELKSSPKPASPEPNRSQSVISSKSAVSDRKSGTLSQPNEQNKVDATNYIVDNDLSTSEFLRMLQNDNLAMSRELSRWREDYAISLDESETSRILRGEPSLKDMGLSAEESSIAGEVVRSKLTNLKEMNLTQLVDFVSSESY